jgi:hypothetical protein
MPRSLLLRSSSAALQTALLERTRLGALGLVLAVIVIRAGEKDLKQVLKELKGIAGKARTQIVKDYIAWPLLSGLVMTGIETAVLTIKNRAERRSRNPVRQARGSAARPRASAATTAT